MDHNENPNQYPLLPKEKIEELREKCLRGWYLMNPNEALHLLANVEQLHDSVKELEKLRTTEAIEYQRRMNLLEKTLAKECELRNLEGKNYRKRIDILERDIAEYSRAEYTKALNDTPILTTPIPTDRERSMDAENAVNRELQKANATITNQLNQLKRENQQLTTRLEERQKFIEDLKSQERFQYAEILRLREGKFTEEEFQNLCHNFVTLDVCRFKQGCREYQSKLFGEKSTEVEQKELEREITWAIREIAWALNIESFAKAISLNIMDQRERKAEKAEKDRKCERAQGRIKIQEDELEKYYPPNDDRL